MLKVIPETCRVQKVIPTTLLFGIEFSTAVWSKQCMEYVDPLR